MFAVTINNISKNYGSKNNSINALSNISLNVEKASLFGLIGPDGAGKTTLFRILTTLLLANEGNASVEGFDVKNNYKEIRSTVGYMPGRFSLYTDLTVEENLNFFANIFNTSIQENYSLIKDIYVQIEPFKNRRAGKLSGGMKQKLALCCALIHKPTILFLDEPTTGVDAVSRKEFWEMLKKLKNEGITILVSTPYMDEASLCDKVALIQNGKILNVNTPNKIIENFSNTLLAVKSNNMLELLKSLKLHEDVQDAYPFGEYHHVVLKESVKTIQLPDDVIIKNVQPNIEDCFMFLMKNNA